MYDKIDNIKIDKIEDIFDKISDKMNGIQIQLKYKWKRKGRHFLIKLKLLYNISEVMEIHLKMLKFEDFYANFHRYNGRHTNQ